MMINEGNKLSWTLMPVDEHEYLYFTLNDVYWFKIVTVDDN